MQYTVFLALSAASAVAAYQNCSSFATNGSVASQYNYYRFYDFRNISSDTWDAVKNATSSNNVTAAASTSDMGWSLDWQRRNDLRYAGDGANLLPIDYQAAKVAMGKKNKRITRRRIIWLTRWA